MNDSTLVISGLTVTIEPDDYAHSPQEYEDDGLFLIGRHRDFHVAPPDHPKGVRFDINEEIMKRKKTHWIFPLEAYIHSGVRLAFGHEGNFPDRRWDVSQVGVVFAAKDEWRLSKKARVAAGALIEEWNQYLSGDVWGYTIDNADGKRLDSCWGFYGFESAKEEAIAAAKAASVKPISTP